MGQGSVSGEAEGSPVATTLTGTLIGAGAGLLVGWIIGEARILGGHVYPDDRTTFFVSAVLVAGAVGAIIGTSFGVLVARKHPVVRTRTLLRGTAFVIAGVGLSFAVFLNDGCRQWVPDNEPGVTPGLLYRCANVDHRMGWRLSIGITGVVVAIALLFLDRAISSTRSADKISVD
jgi:hypothetical protein